MAVLIAFAGLPGTGKSTICRALSVSAGAVYLRVDEIETAIWSHAPDRDLGPEGYLIAAALAASNLELGHTTIIDCVNPWPLTRAIFAAAALRARVPLLGIETCCTDQDVHRQRVEARDIDIPGQKKLDWESVMKRDYIAWKDAALHIDTAKTDVAQAVSQIVQQLENFRTPEMR
ncbi:AAA family ATPase [Martelella sp. HB161492]|uniref:AAA family ATPase n=1 Tax=Martelella sp. HB161492 TaxID=2720726 RepID=UPI00159083AD|nr:AAA family ATPase [Martelella sp. HB161492]